MTSNIISQSAWILILVVVVSKQGKATLNIKPTNTAVLLNGSTFFNCSTFNFSINSEEIVWYHYSVDSDQRKDVYDFGEISYSYKSRFRVEKDLSKGVVNLIVEAPTLEDAGTYECQDGKGISEAARAQLIVLETEPVCQSNIQPDGVIGSNDCGIPPDQVEMSCWITYRGNSPVQLEWRNGLGNDKSSLPAKCDSTASLSTCNLTITGDKTRSNSFFVCQTKYTGMKAYSCSSDVIRILYVTSDNKTISKMSQEHFKCSANSSQNCSYTWYNDGKIASDSDILKPTRSGLYVCKANCTIRGQTCEVQAMSLNVDTTNEETSKTGAIVATIVAIIVATIVAIIAVWWCRRKNEEKKNQDVRVPLQDTMTDNGSTPTAPVDSRVSPESPGVVDAVVPAIQKAFDSYPFICKGLNGDIRGPGQYKDMGVQCAFERIMYSLDQQTQINEEELTKEEKICSSGRRWMDLDQDNLIRFYYVVMQAPAVYIVKEHAIGGSVRNALKKCTECKVILQMPVVRDWATQIAQGMNYLHENNIVYNGLKCAQILIMEPFDPSASTQMTLKIANYSLTSEIDKSNPVTFQGMFAWMAPEAILYSTYSSYSDIWSYGVTVWEILTTEIPFKKNKPGEIINGITNGTLSLKIPDTCPQDLHGIIKECFRREPEGRPAFNEILTRLR